MKKAYSLCLGGGAARGLCHIGVYKYILEQDIQISDLVGTSMGAVIAAAISLGKTPDEILDFTKSINFLSLIDLGSKRGIVAGGKVIKKLEEFLGDPDFSDCKIPLKIVATDLIHQKTKTFSSGKILPAIRASISLPSVLVPQEIDGIKYVDGGLRQNLPVLEADLQNIIAVSAVRELSSPLEEKRNIGRFNFKKSFFSVNYQILKKTIATIMRTNEELCCRIATLEGKEVILLTPNVSGYEYYDFHKVVEISAKGYEEAEKVFNSSVDI